MGRCRVEFGIRAEERGGVRLDFAKEGEGVAAGALVCGRGRGRRRRRHESVGAERRAVGDVGEGDVGADVVEGGGHDGLELCHFVGCVVTEGGHVEERPDPDPLDLLFKYASEHSISMPPFWSPTYPNRLICPSPVDDLLPHPAYSSLDISIYVIRPSPLLDFALRPLPIPAILSPRSRSLAR